LVLSAERLRGAFAPPWAPRRDEEKRLEPEQQGRTVWQGLIGDSPLRVDMLPSGRIFATWSVRGNERRAVVDTVQQLEQRVLFQLMLGAGPGQDEVARKVIGAVQEGQVGLPDPTQAPPVVKRKKKSGRRGPPRSRRRR
jgi:hypothetical protein